MNRPPKLTPREFFDLQIPDREKYLAEVKAWEESPEGIAEKSAKQAAEKARYEALIPPAIREKLQAVGVPDRVLDVLDRALEETTALASVKNARDMLVVSGGCGCGKTVAAGWWLREDVSDPRNWEPRRPRPHRGDTSDDLAVPTWSASDPVWTTSAQLARMDHFNAKEFERVAKAPRLVIDDLGAEYQDAKGFFGSFIDEIINARYSHNLPVVITTNLDVEAFKARYGMRIVDRLREAGDFVACGAVSLRRRSAP